jgi:hypothetical protein
LNDANILQFIPNDGKCTNVEKQGLPKEKQMAK